MDSGKKINYNLRPAKSVERKMICESIRKFSNIRQLDSYQYVGFGSYYFNDFKLFHKEFNIKKLTSIEKNIGDKPRFEFNKPFSCIDILYGESNTKLSEIDWSRPAIVWLDYDQCLDESKLDDIRQVIDEAQSGSVLIVTVNAQPWDIKAITKKTSLIAEKPQQNVKTPEINQNIEVINLRTNNPLPVVIDVTATENIEKARKEIIESESQVIPTISTDGLPQPDSIQAMTDIVYPKVAQDFVDSCFCGFLRSTEIAQKTFESRLDKLKTMVGEKNVPFDVKEKDLPQWGLAKVYRDIIKNKIEETIVMRNAPIKDENYRFEFTPLYFFNYEDGAKMMTYGGVLTDAGQTPAIRGSGFERLNYIRMQGQDAFHISVPNLTSNEIRHLNKLLPNGKIDSAKNMIPETDIKGFSEIYRYFPSFTESDVS